MATQYPAKIDTTLTLPTVIDSITPINGLVFNTQRDAILAIETELGQKPSGIYATVRARLDAVDAAIAAIPSGGGGGGGGGGSVVFSSDLTGNNLAQTVVGFQGRPLANIPPNTGQAILWSGAQWIPSTNFQAQNIATTGSLLAGPAVVSSITALVATLSGKIIVNGLSTSSTLSDAGQGIIYFDTTQNKFLSSENGNAYQPLIFTAGSDLSGTSTSQTVIRINGATVPAAGSLTTSTVLQVSGSSSLTYALLTNANISNSAAIAGTKIAPNFGAQNIITTGNITLSGPLTWASGNAPATGFATSQFPTDANYTAAASELNAKSINVTSAVSLTAVRNYILPLAVGASWIIRNATTGGQDIQAIGTSGIGFNVSTGTSALVWTDGINFYGSSGSGATGFVSNIVSVTNAYSVANNDEVVKASTISLAFAVTLPAPSAAIHKKRISIKDNGGNAATNNITVNRNGATIDGSASNYIIAVNFGSIDLIFDHATNDWSIL